MGAAAGQAIGAGLGAVGGIYNTIQGAKQARDAQDALENYQRQELNNVAEGLQVSTLGSDLQREEQSRLASSQMQTAREGGARTIIGGLGRIQQGNQMVNRQIAADLDMQQRAIDQMRAEDEARIRSMQENREIADIGALSSQINAGNQMKASGISQITQAGSMAGNMFSKGNPTEAMVGGFTTSGSPSNVVSGTNFQSSVDQRFNPNYQLDSYGQPSTYINPFSLKNPYLPTKR